MIRFTLNDVFVKALCLYPFFALLAGLPIMDSLSYWFVPLFVGLALFSFFCERITTGSLLIFMLAMVLVGLNVFYTDPANLSSHKLVALYYPLWIFLFLYVGNNFNALQNCFSKNVPFVLGCVACWNVLMLVSLAMPGNYRGHWGADLYFVSFAGAEHVTASVSTLVAALVWFAARAKQRLWYLVFAVVPTIAIFLSGARTYVMVIFLMIAAAAYGFLRDKRIFWLSLIPMAALVVLVVMLTPMGEKFLVTLFPADGADPLHTFTSGRSNVWRNNLRVYSDLGLWHQLVGNGISFVEKTNLRISGKGHWAHNDFIQVLITYGALGLVNYFAAAIHGLRLAGRRSPGEKTGVPMACLCALWLFNAFFNGIYYYPAAMLAMVPCLMAIYAPAGAPARSNAAPTPLKARRI